MALLSVGGFWLFYILINTLRTAIEGPSWHDQWLMMGRRCGVALIGIGLTVLLLLILRRIEGRSIRVLLTTAFAASFPVSLAYAAANYTLFYVVSPPDSVREEMAKSPEIHMKPLYVIVDAALTWYFFIVAWAVLYVALSYAAKVRQAERATALYRAEAQTAQLRALRYQINPHFLFNTLNSLSTLVLRQSGDEADRMIVNLSNFFRASLTQDPTEDVALADELRMQRLYLDIERVRFPDRLLVAFDVPDRLGAVRVPALILQPLVENAIKYGVSRSARPVTVRVRAWDSGGNIHLTVEDDGEAGPDAAPGHGVGLRNVCDRLAARFGSAASCTHGRLREGGFRVDLVLPLSSDASMS